MPTRAAHTHVSVVCESARVWYVCVCVYVHVHVCVCVCCVCIVYV